MDLNLKEEKDFKFSSLSLEQVRKMHGDFVRHRDWDKFQTPKNVMLAMVGELGEVAETFQWKPDSDCTIGLPKWTNEERMALADELSDVLIYLIRLSDRCHIDLSQIISSKLKVDQQ